MPKNVEHLTLVGALLAAVMLALWLLRQPKTSTSVRITTKNGTVITGVQPGDVAFVGPVKPASAQPGSPGFVGPVLAPQPGDPNFVGPVYGPGDALPQVNLDPLFADPIPGPGSVITA